MESDAAVTQAAIEALTRLATPEAVNALIALTADAARREASVAALAGLADAQTEWVAQGLSHPQPAVRRAIVDALTRMKRSRATDQIVNALGDGDATVRLAAITALGHLGSPRAERTLAALAYSDPDVGVRRAAQAALQK